MRANSPASHRRLRGVGDLVRVGEPFGVCATYVVAGLATCAQNPYPPHNITRVSRGSLHGKQRRLFDRRRLEFFARKLAGETYSPPVVRIAGVAPNPANSRSFRFRSSAHACLSAQLKSCEASRRRPLALRDDLIRHRVQRGDDSFKVRTRGIWRLKTCEFPSSGQLPPSK